MESSVVVPALPLASSAAAPVSQVAVLALILWVSTVVVVDTPNGLAFHVYLLIHLLLIADLPNTRMKEQHAKYDIRDGSTR